MKAMQVEMGISVITSHAQDQVMNEMMDVMCLALEVHMLDENNPAKFIVWRARNCHPMLLFHGLNHSTRELEIMKTLLRNQWPIYFATKLIFLISLWGNVILYAVYHQVFHQLYNMGELLIE